MHDYQLGQRDADRYRTQLARAEQASPVSSTLSNFELSAREKHTAAEQAKVRKHAPQMMSEQYTKSVAAKQQLRQNEKLADANYA